MVINIHIKIILAYSARKKNTKIPAACSVINPLTNSDSASAKSKGALFVSAIEAIKNIANNGNKGIIYHMIFCISIITLKFKDPVAKTIKSKAELNINS
jgi:hypothetical protein